MTFSRRAVLVLGAASLLSACSTVATSIAPEGVTLPGALTVQTSLRRINGTRARHGAAPLKYNTALETAARTQAQLMASKNKMSHELGGRLRDRIIAAGYYGASGENLAQGHKTLESAIEGWLGSSSHRATLLNTRFVEFGIAAAVSAKGVVYWALIEGGPFEAWR